MTVLELSPAVGSNYMLATAAPHTPDELASMSGLECGAHASQ